MSFKWAACENNPVLLLGKPGVFLDISCKIIHNIILIVVVIDDRIIQNLG